MTSRRGEDSLALGPKTGATRILAARTAGRMEDSFESLLNSCQLLPMSSVEDEQLAGVLKDGSKR